MAKTVQSDVELVNRVAGYLEAHAENNPTLDQISQHVHVSPFHMQRVFKRMTGVSPRRYADAVRLELFKKRLRDGANVASALYDAGYGSSSRVYERANDHMGMTPAEYRRGGEGMEIHYTITSSRFGRLLVGMTERGVCAVHIASPDSANADAELEQILYDEYPAATFFQNELICDWIKQIVALVNGSLPHVDLPLDLRATAFQLRVWDQVRSIPKGETRSYGEIAAALGVPGGASAVADAINANPVAFIIPCHRTGKKDGSATRRYSRRSRVVRDLIREYELKQREQQTELAGD
ncbi:methylated-DNA--[protein]-cysteine S-methyltransferase [Anaerolineae bacterium CFX9]|nr:methylated-DNA--[protein]-cysteine S-methyltransferase [Anaerolineae bacterium CFX9]